MFFKYTDFCLFWKYVFLEIAKLVIFREYKCKIIYFLWNQISFWLTAWASNLEEVACLNSKDIWN